MATDEIIEKLEQKEEASVTRFHVIEPAFANQETLTKSFESLFNVANTDAVPISGCVRIFCDWYAWVGLWPCHDYIEGDNVISAPLARLLIHWNSWYDYLINAITDCNGLVGNGFDEAIEDVPDSIRREAILFCRIGLQIAQWLKLEYPQCKVFYLTEWAFDDMIRAEYELILDENGAFQYRCERLLR